MRTYNPNPKHEQPWQGGRRGSKLDLSVAEATHLLNDPVRSIEVPGKRQVVAVKGKDIYVFQDDGAGGYHAYPATGKEVYTKYPAIAARVAALVGVGIKQLSRMEE